ncbi:putative chromatin regulator PHD family [Dioscorea sansibarensis]
MEDQYQSLLCKAGLFVISLMSRWLLGPMSSLWYAYNHDDDSDDEARRHQHRVSAQTVRKILQVATYRDIVAADAGEEGPTCAVCLNQVRSRDRVWELRNCSHIFHKRCLDRWLDHDDQFTCPLCRAPLLASRGVAASLSSPSEASWALEKLLYLFGDDLLFPHLSSAPLDIPSSLAG